jgi:hypothetical protein
MYDDDDKEIICQSFKGIPPIASASCCEVDRVYDLRYQLPLSNEGRPDIGDNYVHLSILPASELVGRRSPGSDKGAVWNGKLLDAR